MDRTEIITKLTEITEKVFGLNDITLTDDMSANTVEQWTSLNFMVLLTEVEKEFNFKFKMMELLNLKTMGDIISSIEKHCA